MGATGKAARGTARKGARGRSLLRRAQLEGVPAGVKKAAAVVAVVAVLVAAARWLPGEGGGGFDIVSASEQAEDGAAGGAGADAAAGAGAGEPAVVVHVVGEVAVPGVYELPASARVADAVEAAGGLTADAAQAGINLAREVSDGEQVIVPSLQGLEQQAASGAGGAAAAGASGGLVNINLATAEELQSLPGIGPSTAASIIAYRTDNGSFKSVEDIQEVSGIGEGKYSKIAALICV